MCNLNVFRGHCTYTTLRNSCFVILKGIIVLKVKSLVSFTLMLFQTCMTSAENKRSLRSKQHLTSLTFIAWTKNRDIFQMCSAKANKCLQVWNDITVSK